MLGPPGLVVGRVGQPSRGKRDVVGGETTRQVGNHHQLTFSVSLSSLLKGGGA